MTIRTGIRTPVAASIAVALIATVLAACVGSAGGAARNAATTKMPDAAVKGCDVLLTAPANHHCLLPWPNDAFTVHASTPTGRRLNVARNIAPANDKGVRVNTASQNKGDGFSPGAEIIAYVPALNLAKSKIAPSTNIGASLAGNAPIVILDTVTHTRVPYFAELDAQTTNKALQLLLIHPARALTEGHRYAVALRNLIDAKGKPIAPLASTKAALAGTLKPATRAAHIKWVIRTDLKTVLGSTVPYQAWDFTVASAKSLGKNGYKIQIARVAVKRAILEAAGGGAK